jgi:hypothetical protein
MQNCSWKVVDLPGSDGSQSRVDKRIMEGTEGESSWN